VVGRSVDELGGKYVVLPRAPPLASFHTTRRPGGASARPAGPRRGGGDMNTETITKRGIESALYVCPATVAASRAVRERVATDDAVTPLQATGLSFAGNAPLGMADAAVAVRSIQQQFVPSHPGDTARRPPA
jgi:hypothetical protein